MALIEFFQQIVRLTSPSHLAALAAAVCLGIVFGALPGLTAAIVTNDLARAMETAERIEAGYVWINSSGRYIGSPYGGWKQSGIGQEECFDELLSSTQVKNINMRW